MKQIFNAAFFLLPPDRDGTEASELRLGGADWEDEVSPTVCDDQVGSSINTTV